MDPHPCSPDDAAWVARIRAGDSQAFEALFRQYAAELADYVYRHLGSKDDAEDVVQVLFTNLWLARERWTLRGPLVSYLYLAARNLMANRRRHERIVADWRARVVRVRRVAGDAAHPAVDDEYQAAETAAAIRAV